MFETTKKKLSLIDMVAFPLSRNLWGYLLPFQGAFIYSLLFCRYKYSVQMSKITSVNIYIVIVNIFFLGLLLFYIFFSNSDRNYIIGTIGLLCLLFPVFFVIASFYSEKIPQYNCMVFVKIRKILISILNDMSALIKNSSFFIKIVIINLSHFLVSFFWFVWVAKTLALELSVISILTLVIVLKILVVVKITPGNLGIEQLVSGGVVSLFSLNSADGIIISAFTKIFSLLLAFGLGSFFTLKNIVFLKEIFTLKK
jgi:hypothetical protein